MKNLDIGENRPGKEIKVSLIQVVDTSPMRLLVSPRQIQEEVEHQGEHDGYQDGGSVEHGRQYTGN